MLMLHNSSQIKSDQIHLTYQSHSNTQQFKIHETAGIFDMKIHVSAVHLIGTQYHSYIRYKNPAECLFQKLHYIVHTKHILQRVVFYVPQVVSSDTLAHTHTSFLQYVKFTQLLPQ